MPPPPKALLQVDLRIDHPSEGCAVRMHMLQRFDGRIVHNPAQITWHRSAEQKICSRHCGRGQWSHAPLQCLRTRRRFCSAECFRKAWDPNLVTSVQDEKPSLVSWEGRVPCILPHREADAWDLLMGEESDTYTPTARDVGFTLCVRVEIDGRQWSVESPVVIGPPPPPFKRSAILNHDSAQYSNLNGTSLRVVTYNVLAPAYATRQMYPYTPIWALAWQYRRRLIVEELRQYKADVVALQEVQTEHFGDISVVMEREGFDGIFKAKTRQRGGGKIDGCALFFRKSKFALIEMHEIEYNASVRQAAANGALRSQDAMKRLMRDNVGQIVVLEFLDGSNQRICVANTHMYWDPEYADVKLWQTHALLLEVDRVVSTHIQGAQLPLVICGDFNSTPDSTVVQLLADGRVDPKHPELTSRFDPCNILPSLEMMHHSLDLFSAYPAVFGRYDVTNFTGNYKGVLDYIWASQSCMIAAAALQLPTEEELQGHDKTPLPNSQFPSDHLALCIDIFIRR